MNEDVKKHNENLKFDILSHVFMSTFLILLIQTTLTLIFQDSNRKSLSLVVILIPLLLLGYLSVTRYKNVLLIGRLIIYLSIPAIVFRAYHTGGVWAVSTNWLYTIPIFATLFLSAKETLWITVYSTISLLVLTYTHYQAPQYALDELTKMPIILRALFFLTPLFVLTYIINHNRKQRVKFLKEIEMQNSIKLQNEKLVSLGVISGGIAHEINNPLTILSGSVMMLKKEMAKKEQTDHDKVMKHLINLESGINRITKIVTSVKSLSSDTDSEIKESFNLFNVIEYSFPLFLNDLNENQITFKNDESNRLDLNGVVIQVQQILINFISNSIYEIKKHESPWITIKTKMISTNSEDNKVFIRCVDSGNGISSDAEQKLFDPFFTTKDVGQGTGLGLSLARKMAVKQGGNIYYELFEGHTSFVLELPLQEI